MRRFVLAAAAALLPVHAGLSQEATVSQAEAINRIVRCMAQGLPADWTSAHMIVKLEHAGDSTGAVQYLVARKDAGDKLQSFTPCGSDEPPSVLIGLREFEPVGRRGWTTARLVLERDGNFRLNYDFPK